MRIVLLEQDGSIYSSFESAYQDVKPTIKTINPETRVSPMDWPDRSHSAPQQYIEWHLDPGVSRHYTLLMDDKYSVYRRSK